MSSVGELRYIAVYLPQHQNRLMKLEKARINEFSCAKAHGNRKETTTMSKYRMNVLFKDTDLDVIKKGSLKVVLVKHTEEQSNSVAWVTFNPFEINTIDWEELFAIYASASEAQSGATINKISESMGQCQVNSIFDSGYFSSAKPDGTIGVNSYEITNDYQVNDGLTFGLAQSVIVNGTASFYSL